MILQHPNILLITVDQLRWDFMDQSTVSGLQIPGISRLREEGVTLTHAYANCPICVPARFSWLHGLYPSQGAAPLMGNAGNWPIDLPTFTQALQMEGYHTALVGKLHARPGIHHADLLATEPEAKRRGFHHVEEVSGKSLSYWHDCHWTRHLRSRGYLERYRIWLQDCLEELQGDGRTARSFLSPDDHIDGYIGCRIRHWLDMYEKQQPFFLHASFCSPHYPIDPSPEFDFYHPDDMPIPFGVSDPDLVKQWQIRRAHYCGLISQVDAEIESLLNYLDQSKYFDNTVVFFCSDHGDMIGDTNRNNKGIAHDSSCRTPMIVRLPNRQCCGEIRDSPIEAVDLPHSILHAAGVANTAQCLPESPGRSFMPYVEGTGPAPREWCYAERSWEGVGWRMIREHRYKYIWHSDQEDELYDMHEDPHELKNLIEDFSFSGVKERMRERLIRALASAPAPRRGEVQHGMYCRWDL